MSNMKVKRSALVRLVVDVGVYERVIPPLDFAQGWVLGHEDEAEFSRTPPS